MLESGPSDAAKAGGAQSVDEVLLQIQALQGKYKTAKLRTESFRRELATAGKTWGSASGRSLLGGHRQT